MKVLIEIPLENYESFVAACDSTSREYGILKNSIVRSAPNQGPSQRVVQTMCDGDEAYKLYRVAVQRCHEVTDRIGAAIAHACNSSVI